MMAGNHKPAEEIRAARVSKRYPSFIVYFDGISLELYFVKYFKTTGSLA